VIGRKNWLFSGSPEGAAASCVVYSLFESAKANSLNPFGYMKMVLLDFEANGHSDELGKSSTLDGFQTESQRTRGLPPQELTVTVL
jgi:hypothetical protein